MINSHMQDIPRKKISFHNLDLVLMHHRQWLDSKGRLGKRAELKGIDLSGRELFGVILTGAVLEGCDLPEPTSNLQRFPMLPLQMSILAGHSFIMHIYRKRYFNILILLSNNPVVIRHPKNHRCAKIITNDQNLHP